MYTIFTISFWYVRINPYFIDVERAHAAAIRNNFTNWTIRISQSIILFCFIIFLFAWCHWTNTTPCVCVLHLIHFNINLILIVNRCSFFSLLLLLRIEVPICFLFVCWSNRNAINCIPILSKKGHYLISPLFALILSISDINESLTQNNWWTTDILNERGQKQH